MNNNPIQQLIAFMNSGGNPQVMIQQMLRQNPQMQNTLMEIKNMVGDRSPKEFALQLAKQKGIDSQHIEELSKRMGAN